MHLEHPAAEHETVSIGHSKSRTRASSSGGCITEAMAPSRGGSMNGAGQWVRDSTNGSLGHRHCASYGI